MKRSSEPPTVEIDKSLMKYVRLLALTASFMIIVLYLYRHHVYMWMTVGGMEEAPITVWVPGFIQYMIWPWIVTLLIAAAGFSVGFALMRKMGKITMQGVSIVYATALGLGLLATATWILGWLHLLYSWILLLMVIGCLAYGWRTFVELEKSIRPFWKNWKWWDVALLVLGCLFVLRTMLLAANPSIGFDATSAHLYEAKYFLGEHVIRYSPLFSFIAFQHMLTVIQMAMGIADPGSLWPYFSMVMASFGLYFIGERYFGRTAGLIAVLAYMLLPMSYITATQWFVAHMLNMYLILMMLAILTWWDTVTYGKDNRRQRSDMRWLIIAGLMGGFACGTKITGLIPVALLILMTGRQWWRTLIWVMIGASPWYLVNLIHFGNPIFPHYEQWFGWLNFGIQEATTQFQSEAQSLPTGFYPWGDPWALTFSINAPWANEGELSEIGPFLLAFTIPLFFIPRKKWTPAAIRIGVFLLVAYAYWLFVEGYFSPRYLLYVAAFHGLLAAYGVAYAMNNYKKVIIPILILLLAIFGYAVTMKYASPTLRYVPIVREHYLHQNFPALQIFKHINENQPDMRLFQIGFKNYRFWADFDMIDDQHIWAYGERYRYYNESAESLYNWLLSLDRTHVLVNEGVEEMWYNQTYDLPKDDPKFFYYFKPVIEFENLKIYELIEDPEREYQAMLMRTQQDDLLNGPDDEGESPGTMDDTSGEVEVPEEGDGSGDMEVIPEPIE